MVHSFPRINLMFIPDICQIYLIATKPLFPAFPLFVPKLNLKYSKVVILCESLCSEKNLKMLFLKLCEPILLALHFARGGETKR